METDEALSQRDISGGEKPAHGDLLVAAGAGKARALPLKVPLLKFSQPRGSQALIHCSSTA